MKRSLLLTLIGLLALPVACADELPDDSGSITLGLRDSVSGWFHVKILEQTPQISTKPVFETGCIDAKSRTYELNNIPSGDDLWVVIESFGSAQCAPESRAEVGYRGGVSIPKGKHAPYYHVPIFEQGASTPFPEDINISAAVAEWIDYCDSDSQCSKFSDSHVCYDGQSPNYWCVPSCSSNADCEGYNARAVCDPATNWCLLHSPYPLNLSSPRAMGHAATLKDGSVAFVGGFGSKVDGRLVASETLVEIFDVSSGLFQKADISGIEGWRAGLSGFTTLSDGRLLVAGGVRSVALTTQGAGADLRLVLGDLTEQDCTSDPCLPNIRNEIVIIDVESRTATVHDLPLPLASPTVLSLGKGRVLVAGGIAPQFGGIGGPPPPGGNSATARTFLVTVGDEVTIRELGEMTVPRVGAAARCQSASCDSVLVVGGNQGGNVAEVISFTGDEAFFIPVAIDGLPDPLWGPVLCGGNLVAGSGIILGSGGLEISSLDPVDGNWKLSALENGDIVSTPLAPAVARAKDGDCWVIGGLGADGRASSMVFRVTEDVVHPKTYEASRARFGAMAAQIGTGLLADGIIFAGGLNVNPIDGANAEVSWVRGAEVLLP